MKGIDIKMSVSEYRKRLEYSSEDNKVELSETIDVLDDIEMQVNDIKDKLEEFANLTEIKTIYKLVEELSSKLY